MARPEYPTACSTRTHNPAGTVSDIVIEKLSSNELVATELQSTPVTSLLPTVLLKDSLIDADNVDETDADMPNPPASTLADTLAEELDSLPLVEDESED